MMTTDTVGRKRENDRQLFATEQQPLRNRDLWFACVIIAVIIYYLSQCWAPRFRNLCTRVLMHRQRQTVTYHEMRD